MKRRRYTIKDLHSEIQILMPFFKDIAASYGLKFHLSPLPKGRSGFANFKTQTIVMYIPHINWFAWCISVFCHELAHFFG